MNFVDVSKGAEGKKEKPDKIVLRTNPMIRGVFTNEETFIGVGFDKAPFSYKKQGGKWTEGTCLDDGIKSERKAKAAANAFAANSQVFKGKQESKLDAAIQCKDKNTKHSNTISDIKIYQGSSSSAQSIATGDINGFIYFWDVSKV